VQQGIPETEMPPSRLPSADAEHIYRYLTYRPVNPAAGDAERGERIFREKGGCLQCHMVRGQGGRLGPELTNIGTRRGASNLREALLDPAASAPDNFAQYRLIIPMPDNYQVVRLRLRDGKEQRGVRVNEDPFSIQIRSMDDRLLSFDKQDVLEVLKEAKTSPMPSYRGRLTDSEIEDVVAYMLSLGVRR
jgi:putative heme-binding domain-containing protein